MTRRGLGVALDDHSPAEDAQNLDQTSSTSVQQIKESEKVSDFERSRRHSTRNGDIVVVASNLSLSLSVL